MKQKLTEREQKVLDFVKKYMIENGFCPSSQEIAEYMNFRQPSTGREVLFKLEEKGYILLPLTGWPRAIHVIGMKFVEAE